MGWVSVSIEWLLDTLSSLPPWAVVFFIAMLPFVELRLAIPVAIALYHMPPLEAFLISVAGNMLPVPFILVFLEDVERFLRRWDRWNRVLDRLFERTRRRAGGKVERWEELAVVLFVAIPLPGTGAWTGSLIAYLFDLDRKKSLACIFLGVLIAGVIVLSLTVAAD